MQQPGEETAQSVQQTPTVDPNQFEVPNTQASPLLTPEKPQTPLGVQSENPTSPQLYTPQETPVSLENTSQEVESPPQQPNYPMESQPPQTPVPPQNVNVPPVVEPPSGGSKSSLPVIIGILVLVAGLIVAAGYYFLAGQSVNPSVANPTPQPSPIVQQIPTPTPTIDPTAGWEVYTNASGFSIKAPSGYILANVDDKSGQIGEQGWFSVSQTNPSDCSGDCPVVDKTSNTTINGLPATLLEGYVGEVGGCVARRYETYVFEGGESFISITFYATNCDNSGVPTDEIVQMKESDRQVFDQILSTFQFTDQSSTGFSDLSGTPTASATATPTQ